MDAKQCMVVTSGWFAADLLVFFDVSAASICNFGY